MYSLRLAALAILSALLVAALTLPLEAGEARSSGNTPFRAGPGERYEVLGKLGQRPVLRSRGLHPRGALVPRFR